MNTKLLAKSYYERIQRQYGEHLEGVTIRQQYLLISLLALSLAKQKYPYEILAVATYPATYNDIGSELLNLVYDCPILAMPELICLIHTNS